MKISVIILLKNGARMIDKTLDSLKEFDDVVIYDNGSTDGSQEIVKKYANVNLIEDKFIGFGPSKNRAVKWTKNDWILAIDSDEVVDKSLIKALKKKLDPKTVYQLNSRAFYKNQRIKYSGWNNQKVKRLYNKKFTKYNDNLVHENIIDKGLKVELLDGFINHYSYTSMSDFLIKMDRYSTLYADENVGKKSSSPLKAITSSIFAFLKIYLFKKAFLDGYIGLVISYSRASVVFYKYMKLYEKNLELNQAKNILR